MSPSAIPNKLADQLRWLQECQPVDKGLRAPTVRNADAERIARLAKRRITTIRQLMQRFKQLPTDLKLFGIHWIETVRPAGFEEFLLDVFRKLPSVRATCASELGWMNSDLALQEFVKIVQTELRSSRPKLRMLDAVICGLKFMDDPAAVEVLVQLYERTDLPGWLRGDAGDALGCAGWSNRRSLLYRRVLKTALEGIHSQDIEVEFWSMYVIMQLATVYSGAVGTKNDLLHPALPRLREIAKSDQRLAPGYWWPMSDEAKDAIHCIRTGNTRKKDAADRWQGNPERGVWTRRY